MIDLGILNQDPDRAQKMEAFKKQRFNRQNDEIRVHNPTNNDYVMDYDGVKWLFPNQQKDTGYGVGDRVVPRYIAERYLEEMVVKLITRESDQMLEKEKAKYKGDWWAGYEEQHALRTNDPKLRAKYIPQLYKGVEKEYGDDTELEAEGIVDSKPITQKMMEEIDASRRASIREISEGESNE